MTVPTAAVFPIGQLVGAQESATGAPSVIRIRLGWELLTLTSPLELELWRLAHGPLDHDWSSPAWTPASVVDHYLDPRRVRERVCNIDTAPLVTDSALVEETLDGLIRKQLVVPLDAVAQFGQATDFVRHHRLLPLLTGLGESAEVAMMERFGLTGQALVTMPATLADMSHRALQYPSLRDMLDEAERFVASQGWVSTPEGNIRQLLADLRTLLVLGAGYLDRVQTPQTSTPPLEPTPTAAPTPIRVPTSSAPPVATSSAARQPTQASEPDSAPTSTQRTRKTKMNEQEYREYITGAPGGVRYSVQNPDTGATYEFDGISGGVLIYGISHTAWRHWVGLAHTQMAAADSHPIEWQVQHEKAASKIAAKLEKVGITHVRVVRRP